MPKRWLGTASAMGHRLPAPALSGTARLVAATLCGLAIPLAALAAETQAGRIFQCTLPDGRRLTSDKPIAECMSSGKSQRELNKDGSQKGVLEAPPTEDEKADRDRVARQREAERTAYFVAVRRDRDMLKRYPDEAAHAKARERALDDVAAAVRSSEARIKLLLKERKPLLEDAEFYVGKPLPSRLKLQLDANDAALEAQRSLVQNQQAEIVRVNKLFDDDLARLKKLWAGAQPGSLGPVPESAQTAVPAAALATVPANATAIAVDRRQASAPR